MRILIAEDDPHLGPTLKKGLEENHYAVDLVTDGEEALSLGLAVTYNLIILVILLPRMDGFEICRQLRNQKRLTPHPLSYSIEWSRSSSYRTGYRG